MTEQAKQKKKNSSPEAINLEILSPQAATQKFKEEVGFDPSDLDELANQLTDSTSEAAQDINKLLDLQKQMAEMLVARFAANMTAFQKYLPNVYEQFINYKPSEDLEFICTSNGVPNLYYPQRDSFFYKSFDPLKLCQTQIDVFLQKGSVVQVLCSDEIDYQGQLHYRYSAELEKAVALDFKQHACQDPKTSISHLASRHSVPITILLGCGLGYHIGYLYEKVEIGNLIIIEPDTDLFYASLHAFDWANLLEFIVANNLGIYFMIGQSEEEVMDDLECYYNRHSYMLGFVLCAITHYRSPKIDKLEQTIINSYSRSYISLGFVDDSIYAISQSIQNMLQKVPFIKRDVPLPEKFTETPIFIVGNGPSLSKDLAVIKKLQDKVIILACGSSIETLYTTGVKPDIYVCTERTHTIHEHLSLIPDRDFLKDCLCLSLDVAHPAIKDFFDKRLTIIKADELSAEMLYRAMPLEALNVTALTNVNPLVGNFGVTVAWSLGFKNIYLFGMDIGTKRDDGVTHAEESEFYQNKATQDYSRIDTQNAVVLDGNFGDKVFTTATYKSSIMAMECSLELKQQQYPNTVVYNCSDGAKIKNTVPLHSNVLLELYDKNRDFPRQEFFDFMLKDKAYLIEPNEQELQRLMAKEEFDKAFANLIKVIDERDLSQIHTRLDYALFLQSIYESMFQTSGNNHIFFLMRGSISVLTSILLKELYKIDDEKLAIKLTDSNLKYLKYLLEDARRVYQYVPNYCMLDHLQFFEKGKLGYDHEESPAQDFKYMSLFVYQNKKQFSQPKFIKRYE